MGVGATALAALLLTSVAPKAVQAAVNALVLVANTSANPVPNADVNAPGEEPFQTQICLSTPGGVGCGPLPDSVVVPSTTEDGLSVKRLVVEEISAQCTTTGLVTHVQTVLNFQTNQNPINGTVYPAIIALPLVDVGGATWVSSITARAYVDPGQSPTLTLGFQGGSGVACTYTIVGSLLTP
jgi:hypothetical protein